MRRRSREPGGRLARGGRVRESSSSCVAEVMGTDLFTVTPDTVVASALRLATARRVHHFLVIEDGNLTGIVCQDDLARARQGTLVGECMTTPVLCIPPETTLGQAADIMQENAVGCLPVVTGAFLVGVITRDRLARMGVRAEDADGAEPDDEAASKPESCVACGSENQVRKELRAGMMSLCGDCSAAIPGTGPLRSN